MKPLRAKILFLPRSLSVLLPGMGLMLWIFLSTTHSVHAGRIEVKFQPAPEPQAEEGSLTGPSLESNRAEPAPVIDGKLDDTCWASAPKIGNFLDLLTGEPVADQTQVQWVVDDANLYVAFLCHKADMANLKTVCDKRDDPVYSDDSIEVFIDSGFAGRTVYHLIASAKGAQYDERVSVWRDADPAATTGAKMALKNFSDIKWNGTWQVAAQQGEKAWTLEARIPASDVIPSDRIPEGSVWGFKVTRNDHPGDDKNVYSSPFGAKAPWLDSSQYARLQLKKGSLPVEVSVSPNRFFLGKNTAALRLVNRTDQPIAGNVAVTVKGEKDAKGFDAKFEVEAGKEITAPMVIDLPGAGAWQIFIKFVSEKGDLLGMRTYEPHLSQTPIQLQAPKSISKGQVKLVAQLQVDLGSKSLEEANLLVQVFGTGNKLVIAPVKEKLTSRTATIEVPLAGIKTGNYELRVEVQLQGRAIPEGMARELFSIP